jgi:hypothetical protein
MQLVSPFPGSVDVAFTFLADAQGFAGDVSNGTSSDVAKSLTEGVRSATRAASELFIATPKSDFQDLVAARRHTMEGVQLLQEARDTIKDANGVDPSVRVKNLAYEAYTKFDWALEILDND